MTGRQRPADNTRGLGVVLRFASALAPLAGFFVVYGLVERNDYGPAVHDLLHNIFRVIAFLWAWPYAMYDQMPLSFGVLALLAIILSAVLLARRDRRGAVAVLLWCFFWGWLLATVIGQD